VLTACQSLQLPSNKLMSLYEQVCVPARAPTQMGVPGRRESETHAHARTHARTHACTHARTHARTHAHTHARTHARTHTRQIILELLELREVDVARAMLRQTECMLTMKQEQPERHMRLEALASRPIWCVRMCVSGACLCG
jgi:hypothetical protein